MLDGLSREDAVFPRSVAFLSARDDGEGVVREPRAVADAADREADLIAALLMDADERPILRQGRKIWKLADLDCRVDESA